MFMLLNEIEAEKAKQEKAVGAEDFEAALNYKTRTELERKSKTIQKI